jgi:cbb3-type cytochrome oxidase maturation protein
MDILFLLIPLALVLAGVVAWFFIWSVNHRQFEDMEGPAHEILMDDDRPVKSDTDTTVQK